MRGLDTNILARYYIQDAADEEAGHQRLAAKRVIESGEHLAVCKTVILELEWIMRGHYGCRPEDFLNVLRHLLTLPQLTMEDRDCVQSALLHSSRGLDFADALHHASYQVCDLMASFDNRRFARRVKRLGLRPPIIIPA